eukprot:364881_1
MAVNLTSTTTSMFLNSITEAVQNVEKQYITKLEEKQTLIKELQNEINELKQQLQYTNKTSSTPPLGKYNSNAIDEILDEIQQNEEKYNEENETDLDIEDVKELDKKKTEEFWKDIEQKLKQRNFEEIKDLVRKKEIKMDDINSTGRNLLMLSAKYGSYELVSMCINLGADIDIEDKNRQTA